VGSAVGDIIHLKFLLGFLPRVGAQARYPCAPASFRLPSALVCHTLSMKNAPAGRSKADVLKLFDG
jgi:hypothetical protein